MQKTIGIWCKTMIWKWVNEDYWRWKRTDDERLQMANCLYTAFRVLKDDLEGALSLFEQGHALATQWDERWWLMLFEHWKLQMLLRLNRNDEALKLAARCTVEVRKPIYISLPQRICLHEDLISTYFHQDPQGFAPLIRNALNYMEQEMTPGYECALCHQSLLAEFLAFIGDKSAITAAWRYAEMAEERDDDNHRHSAANTLCVVLMELAPQTAHEQIGSIALLGEAAAKRKNNVSRIAEMVMWQALAALWLGDFETAQLLHRKATNPQSRLKFPSNSFIDATVAYHQASNDPKKALKMVERELEHLTGKGETFREVRQRVLQCQLLSELHLSFTTEAEVTRKVAQKLKNPAPYLEKLAMLKTI